MLTLSLSLREAGIIAQALELYREDVVERLGESPHEKQLWEHRLREVDELLTRRHVSTAVDAKGMRF